MRRLRVFNFVTMNGYFQGVNGDISFGHNRAQNDYAAEMLSANDILLFGRKTYELMVQFWPTDEAMKTIPEVAQGMNKAAKIIFSRTLKDVDWSNARVVNDDAVEAIRKMKQTDGPNMTVLGSASIVNQFADAGLIDEIQLLIHPVALSDGTPFLKDINCKVEFELKDSRVFDTGNVLLVYETAG